MTWDQLLEETALRARCSRTEAEATLNAFFDAVIDRMETEDVVPMRPDFGHFELRAAGGARSPKEQSIPKARRTPVFKKSGALKKQLRQSDEAYLDMLREAGRSAQADRLRRKQRSDHSA